MYTISGVIQSGPTSCSGIKVAVRDSNQNLIKKVDALADCSFTLSWLYSEYQTRTTEEISINIDSFAGYTSTVVQLSISETTLSYSS